MSNETNDLTFNDALVPNEEFTFNSNVVGYEFNNLTAATVVDYDYNNLFAILESEAILPSTSINEAVHAENVLITTMNTPVALVSRQKLTDRTTLYTGSDGRTYCFGITGDRYSIYNPAGELFRSGSVKEGREAYKLYYEGESNKLNSSEETAAEIRGLLSGEIKESENFRVFNDIVLYPDDGAFITLEDDKLKVKPFSAFGDITTNANL